MNSRILELFGIATDSANVRWKDLVHEQYCPYLNRKCVKNRKSEPEIAIGTCTVGYGKNARSMIICPCRLLERKQIFTDCLHLLTVHEPGNELHVVPEVSVPGGSVDYFLASAKDRKVRDFTAIELQTLDTTGTVWPERQRLLHNHGVSTHAADRASQKPFGMNWKMTAKTALMHIHHKIEIFENVNKRLVLVIQDHLMSYMRREFSFDHLVPARLGDPMHIHSYSLMHSGDGLRLELRERLSTDAAGIARCLDLKASANVEVAEIVAALEAKLSDQTLLML